MAVLTSTSQAHRFSAETSVPFSATISGGASRITFPLHRERRPVNCSTASFTAFSSPRTRSSSMAFCSGLSRHPYYGTNHSKTPTTQAAMREDRAPPNMATIPSRERSERRVGAMPLMPPTWMATLEKLAKPQRA